MMEGNLVTTYCPKCNCSVDVNAAVCGSCGVKFWPHGWTKPVQIPLVEEKRLSPLLDDDASSRRAERQTLPHSSLTNLLLRTVGFLTGATFIVAIEASLLLILGLVFNRELMPRGPGWLLLPLAFGVTASAAAPNIWLRIEAGDFMLVRRFNSASSLVRFAVVFPVFWSLCVGAYVYLFEPYGYMVDSDYFHMLKVMIFPPVVLLVGLFFYQKLIAPR